MRRRRREAAPENHERWLVSYADFITLLFAFFVVMFASGQTSRAKAKQVAESVKKGFNEQVLVESVSKMLGGPVKHVTVVERAQGTGQKSGDLSDTYTTLLGLLETEVKKGSVTLNMDPRGLVISLKEAAFFGSGNDDIPESASSTMLKIGSALARLQNPVRLEGHTDSVPIRNDRFRDNWDLSTARAIAMLHALTDQGLDTKRFSVCGYADSIPVSDNDTEEGRARNRRVDIVVLNPEASRLDGRGKLSALP